MIFDIIVLVILIVPMAKGLAKGFIYIFLHTLGWVGAVIAAFYLAPPLADFLEEGFLGSLISGGLLDKFYGSTDAVESAVDGLPAIISGGLTATVDSVSDLFVALLTSTLISIISFLFIVFLIRFLLSYIIRPVSKRHGPAVLETADKGLGLLAGFIEGILLVFIFLALLVPFVNFTWTGLSSTIVSGLDSSFIAGSLYDSILLLLVTGGFFS